VQKADGVIIPWPDEMYKFVKAQCRSLIEVLVNVRFLEPYDYPNTVAYSPQGPKSEMMMLADKIMFHPPASPIYPQNVLYPWPMPTPRMFPFLRLRRSFVSTACGSEALYDENSAVSSRNRLATPIGRGSLPLLATRSDMSTNATD